MFDDELRAMVAGLAPVLRAHVDKRTDERVAEKTADLERRLAALEARQAAPAPAEADPGRLTLEASADDTTCRPN